jgi:DNA-binding NarL/FixJ family response regulator
MPSILIVDDHAVVRRGLQEILSEELGPVDFGSAQNGAEALEQAARQFWDLIVLDISMPDRNGIDLIKDLRRLHHKVPVLVLSMYPESQYAIRAIKAGAMGYVTKQSAAKELVKAVATVLDGRKYISTALTHKLILDLQQSASTTAPHESLSDREYQVLCEVGSRRSVREIAGNMGLSTKTVSTYRLRVGEKIGLKSNADFARYCLEHGLAE